MEGKLTITVVEAKLMRDTEAIGKMDPYVSLKIGTTEKLTKVQENAGKEIKWNEKFEFDKQFQDETIEIKVLEKDSMSSDTVGSCIYSLDQFQDFTQQKDFKVDIYYNGQSAGDLLLQIQFNKNQQPSQALEEVKKKYKKKVILYTMKATLTKDDELIGKIDPYAIFTLNKDQHFKTSVAEDCGINPIWGDVFVFWVNDETTINVEVFNEGMSDSKIGEGQLKIDTLKSGKQQSSLILQTKNGNAGNFFFKANVTFLRGDEKPLENKATGIIKIEGIKGNLLKDGTFSKIDPYCVLKMGTNMDKTEIHENGGKTPSWKEIFEFQREKEEQIDVEVWDEELIGFGQLQLKEALANSGKPQKGLKIDLQLNKKPAGQLSLDLTYTEIIDPEAIKKKQEEIKKNEEERKKVQEIQKKELEKKQQEQKQKEQEQKQKEQEQKQKELDQKQKQKEIDQKQQEQKDKDNQAILKQQQQDQDDKQKKQKAEEEQKKLEDKKKLNVQQDKEANQKVNTQQQDSIIVEQNKSTLQNKSHTSNKIDKSTLMSNQSQLLGYGIQEYQSSSTLQHSIPYITIPKQERFKNESLNLKPQPTTNLHLPSIFDLPAQKGTSFGYGKKQPLPDHVIKNATYIPAPGQYDQEIDYQQTINPKGPTFGIGREHYLKVGIPNVKIVDITQAKYLPGPGAYGSLHDFGKSKSKFTIGNKHKAMPQSTFPASNQYSPTYNYVQQMRYNGIKIGTGQRQNFINSYGPGPGAYNLSSKFDKYQRRLMPISSSQTLTLSNQIPSNQINSHNKQENNNIQNNNIKNQEPKEQKSNLASNQNLDNATNNKDIKNQDLQIQEPDQPNAQNLDQIDIQNIKK